MKFENLGVILFFGVIIPGSYLTLLVLLVFAGILKLNGICVHDDILKFISSNTLMLFLIFFLSSYLLGIVLRLFALSLIDEISEWYLKHIHRKKYRCDLDDKEKGICIQGTFPYLESVRGLMNNQGMPEVPKLIESLNKNYGK